MKTIPNTHFKIRINPDSKKTANTADLLSLVLQQPPPSGFDLATMKKRLKVLDYLESLPDGKELKLEDADFSLCTECISAFRWSSQHPDIVKFASLFGL